MKHLNRLRKITPLLFICLALSTRVQAQEIDSFAAENTADRIIDSSLVFGIFECPGSGAIRHLKNGIVPEEQDKYLDHMLNYGLIKLNTISASSNAVDSDIFIPMPFMAIESEYPMQFVPYPDTRWLLFLKDGYNEDRHPQLDWVIHLDKPAVGKYLMPGTVYEITDPYLGNVCLLWNSNYPTQPHIPLAKEVLMEDLKNIRNTLLHLPYGEAHKQERTTQLNQITRQMKDPFGKAVAEFVKRKKM
jgi:hypothetical protein